MYIQPYFYTNFWFNMINVILEYSSQTNKYYFLQDVCNHTSRSTWQRNPSISHHEHFRIYQKYLDNNLPFFVPVSHFTEFSINEVVCKHLSGIESRYQITRVCHITENKFWTMVIVKNIGCLINLGIQSTTARRKTMFIFSKSIIFDRYVCS